MPSKVKCFIFEARNLPVMNRSLNSTEAFIEIKWGSFPVKRTPVIRDVNPKWNTGHKYEIVEDSILQNFPVEIRVYDKDVIAEAKIGTVIIDLSPLVNSQEIPSIEGWFPIVDVAKGIRGEVKIGFKISFFKDENVLRNASTSIRFLSPLSYPPKNCFEVEAFLGFVEELITIKVSDYKLERMKLIYETCLKLRRKLGKKVLELRGNAILGFSQEIDDETQRTHKLVVRGYGTAAIVTDTKKAKYPKIKEMGIGPLHAGLAFSQKIEKKGFSPLFLSQEIDTKSGIPRIKLPEAALSGSPESKGIGSIGGGKGNVVSLVRKTSHSISDELKLNTSTVNVVTLSSLPTSINYKIASVVTARSVKLLNSKLTQADRDGFWQNLREEIYQSTLSLHCNYILAYRESSSIYDDILILSITGTAVQVFSTEKLVLSRKNKVTRTHTEMRDSPVLEKSKSSRIGSISPLLKGLKKKRRYCEIFHQIKFLKLVSTNSEEMQNKMTKCLECNKEFVPEIIIATIAPPDKINIIGKSKLINARVCRPTRKEKGEIGALSISDELVFLEYDMHSQLLWKMGLLNMNALFSLVTDIYFNEGFIIAVATATALRLKALPIPKILQVHRDHKYLSVQEDSIGDRVIKISEFYARQSFNFSIRKVKSPMYQQEYLKYSGKKPKKYQNEKDEDSDESYSDDLGLDKDKDLVFPTIKETQEMKEVSVVNANSPPKEETKQEESEEALQLKEEHKTTAFEEMQEIKRETEDEELKEEEDSFIDNQDIEEHAEIHQIVFEHGAKQQSTPITPYKNNEFKRELLSPNTEEHPTPLHNEKKGKKNKRKNEILDKQGVIKSGRKTKFDFESKIAELELIDGRKYSEDSGSPTALCTPSKGIRTLNTNNQNITGSGNDNIKNTLTISTSNIPPPHITAKDGVGVFSKAVHALSFECLNRKSKLEFPEIPRSVGSNILNSRSPSPSQQFPKLSDSSPLALLEQLENKNNIHDPSTPNNNHYSKFNNSPQLFQNLNNQFALKMKRIPRSNSIEEEELSFFLPDNSAVNFRAEIAKGIVSAEDIHTLIETYNNNENFEQFDLFKRDSSKFLARRESWTNPFLIEENKVAVELLKQQVSENNLDTRSEGASFKIEVDDARDQDLLGGTLDPIPPSDMTLSNAEFCPSYEYPITNTPLPIKLICKIFEFEWEDSENDFLNQKLTDIFNKLLTQLLFLLQIQNFTPCIICSLQHQILLQEDNLMYILVTGAAFLEENKQNEGEYEEDLSFLQKEKELLPQLIPQIPDFLKVSQTCSKSEDRVREVERISKKKKQLNNVSQNLSKLTFELENKNIENVLLIPLSYIPSKIIKDYFGFIDVHLIREAYGVKEQEVSQKLQRFISEAHQIMRSRVQAVGGNCLLGYRIHFFQLERESQTQITFCISIAGNAVYYE